MIRNTNSPGFQAVAIAVGMGLSQIIIAYIYIFTARSASPALYGVQVSQIALGMMAAGFFDFGSNALWVRELASNTLSITDVTNRSIAKIIIALLSVFLLTVISIVFNSNYLNSFLIFISAVILQTQIVPIKAIRQGLTVAIISLLDRLSAVAIFFMSIKLGILPLNALAPSLALGSLIAATYCTYKTYISQKIRPTGIFFINPWKGSQHYGFSSLAVSAQQFDIIILGSVAGNSASGIYGAVNRWTQPIGLLATAFSSASAPFVAKAKTLGEAIHVVTRAIWLLGIAIIGALSISLLSPLLVVSFLGQNYSSSALLLRVLALGMVPAVLNQPLSMALQARRHDKLVAAVVTIGVLSQLLGTALFGHLFGSIGAALSFCMNQLIIFIALSTAILIYVKRENNNRL